MTQLENNTTALEAILATVNALPDAGSGGGEVRIITGKVKATNKNVYSVPINVTGIGFKPKLVIFMYPGNITVNTSTPYYIKTMIWYEGMENTIYYNVAMMSSKTYTPTAERTGITVNEDGFTIQAARSDYQLYSTEIKHQYIVCG